MRDDATIDLLVDQAKANDQKAFAALLHQFEPLIEGLSTAKIVWHDADDIRSEASLALSRAVQTHIPAKGSFQSYATSCIKNRVIDLQRIRRNEFYKTLPETSFEFLSDGDPFSDLHDDSASNEILCKIAPALSRWELQVITMVALFPEDSYVSIAYSLNKSRDSVESAVKRVRRKIKERFPDLAENRIPL